MAGVTPLSKTQRELLVDVAEAIRRTAVSVFDVEPQGSPATSRFAVGDADSFCCGAVTVILRRIIPTNAAGGDCAPMLWAAEWIVDVSRDCPPGLGSVYNMLPTPTAERAADVLLLLDAAVLFQAFAGDVRAAVTAVIRKDRHVPGCVAFRPSVIEPYTRGECVGWKFTFTTGLV